MGIVVWMKTVVWFLCGAVIYPVIELLWRGHSHWSLALAGGACTVLLLFLNGLFPALARPVRALIGGGLICTVEFLFGAVFNLLLGLAIWDYSGLSFHIMGQVSLRYFLLWCGFSYLLTFLFDRVWEATDIREEIFRAAV